MLSKKQIQNNILDYLTSDKKDILIYQEWNQKIYYTPNTSIVKVSIIDPVNNVYTYASIKITWLSKYLQKIIIDINLNLN